MSDTPSDGRENAVDAAAASTGFISGRIADVENNDVANAVIRAIDKSTGVIKGSTETDSGGNYLIEVPAPNTYVVQVEKPEYELAEAEASVSNGSTWTVNIAVRSAPLKVLGQLSDASGSGVIGRNPTGTGNTYGVVGETRSAGDSATGVRGKASADSGTTYGVAGYNASGNARSAAVFGDALGQGIGVGSRGRLDATRSVATDGSFAGHVATFSNTSGDTLGDVLALKADVSSPGSSVNYVSFFDSGGEIGAIEGDGAGGVHFTGTTADFAEWFPKADPDDEFEPGTVVGLEDGAVVPAEAEADAAFVVSTAPLVTGNRPLDEADRDAFVDLALVGQVPVAVSAPVESGDLLVASPDGDGTAVPRRTVEGSDLPTIGLALDDDGGDGEVPTLVGAGGIDASRNATGPEVTGWDDVADRIADLEADLERKDERIDAQQGQIADLEAENDRLRDRLAAIEDRLTAVETADAPAPADD